MPGSTLAGASSLNAPLYVETSAILRAVLETGTSEDIEHRLAGAETLITSRLSLVESSRALLRARLLGRFRDEEISGLGHQLEQFWRQCEIWELTSGVARLAESVAPRTHLRSLDALHLATYLIARQHIVGLELLTADERLRAAVES